MKKSRFLCVILAVIVLMQMITIPAFAEYVPASELTWIASNPGVVRFKVVDYTNQYSLWLYKDGEYVYHTYCYYDEEYVKETSNDVGYLTVEYPMYSMAELGDGTYTYKIGAMKRLEDGTFERLSTSEMSEPFVYKKPPELQQATNVKFEDNILTWDSNLSLIDRFEIKFFYTYDGLDFYELTFMFVYDETSFEVNQSFWDHYHSQTQLWHDIDSEKYPIDKVRFAAQIYSIPKDRTAYELVATDCIFLTGTSEQGVSGEYSKVISLTVGSTEANINGKIESTDAPPQIVNNRTMLPIRIIAENLGATVAWNPDSRTVDITKDDIKILITIDSATAYVNDEPVSLDVTAFIENDRTYLPVRFISENLGADVSWDGNTKTVTIQAR